MIEHFKAEIKKATEDKIKVESNLRTHGRMSSKSDDELGSLSGGRSDGPRPHDWIDRMEQFRSALFAVHAILKIKGLTPPRIKVRDRKCPQ